MTRYLAILFLLTVDISGSTDVSLIQSADFGGNLDNSIWKFINPLGDGSLELTDDMLLLNVPAGTRHLPFIDGVDNAVRLIQSISDQDFSIEVKLTTLPSLQNQIEGILVEQDGLNVVRVQLTRDDTTLRIALITVEDGIEAVQSDTALPYSGPPFWIRLRRIGDTWSASWSNNGYAFTAETVFSAKMHLNGIGVFAGNSGIASASAPAFTAGITYLHALPTSPTQLPLALTNAVVAPLLDSAVVKWTTNSPATSRVDFGLDAGYGEIAANNNPLTEHAVELLGLTCDSSYRFRLASTSVNSDTVRSGELNFNTLACGSNPVGSDDFSGPILNTARWAWVSPSPGAVVGMNGKGALLSLSAGSPHDFLPLGNTTARLLQSIPNSNFDVEARFDSVVTSGYQSQGIVVGQDSTNYLRFELHHDGAKPQLYAANYSSGTIDSEYSAPFIHNAAPLWLRIVRNGSTWNLLWSIDHITFTPLAQFDRVLVVRNVGPFAANNLFNGQVPAFTASVDSFIERSNPLDSVDGGAPGFERVVIDSNPPASVLEKALADVDGDGRQDAIIGFSNPSPGGIYWYEFPHSGNAIDSWNKHTISPDGTALEDMAAADMNGDGAVDIVASMNGPVYWFENPRGTLGNPAQKLWRKHLIGSGGNGGRSIAVTDMDGDGKPDVITDSYLAFQDGPDSWTTIDYGAALSGNYAVSSNGVALLDIGSGRGAVNIVTLGRSPFGIVWFENPIEHGGDPRKDTWIPHLIGPAFGSQPDTLGVFATADLNGDGRMDVVTAGKSLGRSSGFLPGLTWWEAPIDFRSGTWIRHSIDPTFSQVQKIAVADVDGDGILDIISAEQDQSPTHRLSVYYSDGHGHFRPQVLSNGGGHAVAVDDVRGIGRPDILNGAHGFFGGSHPIELWLNRGPSITSK